VRIIDFFDRGWRIHPDGPALVMDDRAWSYTEVGELSFRIGNALLAAGLGRGTNVAVLSPNDPAAMICVLGLWRAGCTWVPLNPANPVADTRNLLERFDGELVFFHSSQQDAVDELRRSSARPPQLVCLDRDLDDWVAGAEPTARELPYRPEDVVAIMPTGGTTGPSKGAMITHRSMAVAIAHMLIAFHYPARSSIVNLAAAPLTHTAGFLTMPTLARGGTVVLLRKPAPAALVDAIERHGVTELFLPPTVIYRLLELDDLAEHDLSSLRYLLYGAAPMSTAKLRRAIEVLGPVLMGGYGQVEAFASISYLRPEEHLVDGRIAGDDRLGSAGRPCPLISLRVLDDAGTEVGPGVTGEICVRGDLVMAGYYRDPEATAASVVDGWLHTGDVGYLDHDGYLHITDRKKDVIISGGFNVYPAEVEQVLLAQPAVQDCAVVGAPHPDWGEAVTAVVELVPGATVDPAELVAACRAALGPVRTPKRVDLVDSLPRSPAGKVLRREVRAPYWAGTDRTI
jgi:acyl-CoA synthetase (AMP-forming)/AMP-acid ligase II